MAPTEGIRRLKYLYQMKKALDKDDYAAVTRALGHYQEWYVAPDEVKTSPSAKTAAQKFINSLRGRE